MLYTCSNYNPINLHLNIEFLRCEMCIKEKERWMIPNDQKNKQKINKERARERERDTSNTHKHRTYLKKNQFFFSRLVCVWECHNINIIKASLICYRNKLISKILVVFVSVCVRVCFHSEFTYHYELINIKKSLSQFFD